MIIVGVDIETANLRGAVCEFGAVGLDIDTGRELFVIASLVDPGEVSWDPFAMAVHGIRPHQVLGKPSITEVWDRFLTELEYQAGVTGRPSRVFAHNASFERSQLTHALGPRMTVQFECTVRLARKGLAANPPVNHKLPTVCRALGIPFRETHRAEADARAAAEIARRLVIAAEPQPNRPAERSAPS